MENGKPKRLIRIDEVCRLVPLSKSAIYKKIRQGEFPRGIRIGGQAVAWLESEIDEWVDHQADKHRADLDEWLTPERKAAMREARKAVQS